MSEIEKMMQNAGIKMQHLLDVNTNQFVDIYPPFTAEKQIELIKLLGNCKGYPDYEGFGADFDFYAQLYEFKTALVKSINDRWQYLADDLKQQIKEILE